MPIEHRKKSTLRVGPGRIWIAYNPYRTVRLYVNRPKRCASTYKVIAVELNLKKGS